MAWAAAIPAIAAVVGAGIGFISQQNANRQNREMADSNTAWQQWMSGSAHQREVEDLRKAGLNPILSAKLGGASTPSGNVSQNIGELQAGWNSGKETAAAAAEVQNTQADTDVKVAQEKLAGEQQGTEKTVQAKNLADAANSSAQTILAREQLKKAKAEGSTYQILDKYIKAADKKVLDSQIFSGKVGERLGESFSEVKKNLYKGSNKPELRMP